MQTIKTILLLLTVTLISHANLQPQTTYNENNQPLVIEYANGNTILYEYDQAGNITLIETPTQSISKTYDALNRLSTVTDSSGVITYTYDAIGRNTTIDYSNGMQTTYSYDGRNRITNIIHTNSSGDVLQSFAYTLNDKGYRTKIVEHSGREVAYTYNEVDQLTSESITNDSNGHNTVTNFTYDVIGNLLTKTIDGVDTSYSYNENDQLTQKGSTTLTYDDNGNLIRQDNNTYEYDDKNRLTKVTTVNDTVEYSYDANDNRIAKVVNGDTTTYLIDTNTNYAQVITESKADGTTIDYTYGNDLLTQTVDAQSLFYLADALGSVKALANQSENITDHYTYSPYGTLIEHVGTNENAFMFTGEQFDSVIDGYYLRARYYSPSLSRFLSRDTYDGRDYEPATLNHYGYTHGNPVNYVDPSGHMTMMGLSISTATLGILAGGAITSLGILNNNRGGYGGSVWLTVGIYNAQTFLRAELLPTFWLIGEVLTWQEEKLKTSRYNHHKPRCDEPPREADYSSKCAYYAALIAHSESCVRAFESWDKAYKQGRHADKIQQFKNTAKNNKKLYKKSCR